ISDQSYSLNELHYFDTEGNPIGQEEQIDEMRVGIRGTPSFGDVRVIMLGVKNNGATDASGEVWFNEMRLAGMKDRGGWAANFNMDTNLADLLFVSANAQKSTIGFGALD